ncbi:MAG: ABC transporter ATP-binding protein [Cyanobacteria bacterium SBLK]|nr:ABC transporter ATP-binding protein [Cyanobacteria bacterium SBLK]
MTPRQLLFKFALRHPFLVILTILSGFSGAIFNGVSTALIVPLILGFLGQDNQLLKKGPAVLQKFLSFFDSFAGDWKYLAMLGSVLLAIILKNLTAYISAITTSYFSQYLTNVMRLEGLKLLLEVDLDYYSKTKVGDIVNFLNREIGRTVNAIKLSLQILTNSITILVFLWILLSLSWQLTLISTLLLGCLSLSNQHLIKKAKTYGRLVSQKSNAYSGKLLEILTGIRLIKTSSTEELEYQRITKIIREREQIELKAQANYAILNPINEVGGIVIVIAIVALGRYFFLDGLQSLSTILLIYLVTLFRLLPIIGKLNTHRSRFANAIPSAAIAASFLQRDDKPIMENGTRQFQSFTRGLRFENVAFAYPGHDESVLQDIDLWVPKGTTVALVGSSGAGKSTLVDLVPRYYDPVRGRITIDEIDLKDFQFRSLRRAMGVVAQDTFLFNNTVAYNIAYGKDEATEVEIIEAAKRACAYDFIMDLPQGFQTEIGDRGTLLSGGQRQRLAIARALLRDPQILILDEATSALDTISERLVQKAIDELCRDRTTLVIAHRLSTVRQADKIAVMDKGRIVEFGNHEELLALDGQYAKLYRMQFGKQASKVVLPTNASLIRASLRASRELRYRLSYEVRTRLNAMLGLLQLVTEDLVDTPEEREELIEESYEAALQLLNTLAFYEEHGAQLSNREV